MIELYTILSVSAICRCTGPVALETNLQNTESFARCGTIEYKGIQMFIFSIYIIAMYMF